MLNNPAEAQKAKAQQDSIVLLFSGMVHLGDISKLILQNGKQAIASLIIAMASASKQGMSNEQIQETLSIINSCIAMAESNNPTQSLKSLMTNITATPLTIKTIFILFFTFFKI